MPCYICGRNSCCPSFHSLEEQSFFERAEEAYDRYLDILEECKSDYNNSGIDEEK